MAVRCAILDDYQNVVLKVADWSKVKGDVDIKIFNAHLGGPANVIAALKGFQIIVAMRERTAFPRQVIDALPDLKLLITTGARNASIDIDAAKARGITVCGTGSFGHPTSAIAIGLMIEFTRHIGYENAALHAGAAWQTTIGPDLEGLTLGVLGLGKLGSRTATIAKAFGMKVIAWSQNLTPEKCREAGVGHVGKDELFRQSDFITIHVVLSPRSRGLVGARELGLMKPSAFLINTSRGPIVDEAALVAALRDNKIAGAGLDVFDVEPLPLGHPLRRDRQRRHHAASRLRLRAELPGLFRRRGRGHPRFSRRQAGAGADVSEPLIDFYCHIYPDRFFQEMNKTAPKLGNIASRLRSVRKIHDLEARFREMDEFGDYRQVISLPNPPIEDFATPGQGLGLARVANDAMAELCVKHPDRFAGFVAALSLTDVMGSVAEAKRAINELGAAGVQIFSPLAGRPLDEPVFEPLYAAMAQLDRPIWLHPARTAAMPDYAVEQKSRFEMWWCFGWPYDTSVAMVRLAFCGLFDRYPNLKIITHHLGGMIPYYDGRIGPGLDVLGARTSDEDYSRILPSLKRPHLDYMHDFYADTAMFGGGVHALRCGFDFFGPDKVVFATDTPLGPIKPAIAALKALDVSAVDRRKIFSGNAERLLKKKSN